MKSPLFLQLPLQLSSAFALPRLTDLRDALVIFNFVALIQLGFALEQRLVVKIHFAVARQL